jgi:hypothetical protein
MESEILKAALAPGRDCLAIEQLGRYADGALDADERRAAASHIRGCLNCQAELSLLQASTSSAIRPDEADAVRDGVAWLEQRMAAITGMARKENRAVRRWIPFGVLRPVAALAIVLLVVAGGVYLIKPKAPVLPASVSTGNEVTRSLSVPVRAPLGDLVEAPRRFEWFAVARAVRYRVRLMEVDRHEVWSTSTATPAIDIPVEVRARIVPSKTLVWDVTAYDASGGLVAESGRQSFRLVAR